MPRGKTKVPTQFDPAESVEELAKELIKLYHPYLATQNIAYLFKNKEMVSKGKRVLATVEKCSAKVKALFDCDFIITVPYPTYQELTSKEKRAVVDHELTHIEILEDDTGESKARLIPHDVDEFEEIIRRHGLYKKDLERLGKVINKVKKKKKKKKIKKRKVNPDPVEQAINDFNLINEDE